MLRRTHNNEDDSSTSSLNSDETGDTPKSVLAQSKKRRTNAAGLAVRVPCISRPTLTSCAHWLLAVTPGRQSARASLLRLARLEPLRLEQQLWVCTRLTGRARRNLAGDRSP